MNLVVDNKFRLELAVGNTPPKIGDGNKALAVANTKTVYAGKKVEISGQLY